MNDWNIISTLQVQVGVLDFINRVNIFTPKPSRSRLCIHILQLQNSKVEKSFLGSSFRFEIINISIFVSYCVVRRAWNEYSDMLINEAYNAIFVC